MVIMNHSSPSNHQDEAWSTAILHYKPLFSPTHHGSSHGEWLQGPRTAAADSWTPANVAAWRAALGAGSAGRSYAGGSGAPYLGAEKDGKNLGVLPRSNGASMNLEVFEMWIFFCAFLWESRIGDISSNPRGWPCLRIATLSVEIDV